MYKNRCILISDTSRLMDGATLGTLRIYADETGTMPVKDTDGIFLVTTVSTLGDHPDEDDVDFHRLELLRILKEKAYYPFVAYVRPISGYSSALSSRMSKMNTMARYTRLLTGSNSEYLTQDGFRTRNHIWTLAMVLGISRAIMNAVLRGPVAAVRIYLDQKTMAKPARRFFADQIRQIGPEIQNTLERLKEHHPESAKLYKERAMFDVRHITVRWSDDPECARARHGLLLPHHVGKNIWLELNAPDYDGASDALTTAVANITPIVIAPVSRDAIENWCRKTGLPEPRD